MNMHIWFSCNYFLCPGIGNAYKTIQGEFTRGQVITVPPRHLAFSSSCFCEECHQNHQLWYSLNTFFFFFFWLYAAKIFFLFLLPKPVEEPVRSKCYLSNFLFNLLCSNQRVYMALISLFFCCYSFFVLFLYHLKTLLKQMNICHKVPGLCLPPYPS